MTLLWTYPTLIFSALVLVVAIVVSAAAWRRSGYSRGMGLLELLRVVLVALVLFTLNQPEIITEEMPTERPRLVVLHDVSGSMATQDVLNADQPAEPPKTRLQIVEPLIAEENWARVATRLDLSFEPFSSELTNPEEATDIAAALQRTLDQHANLRGVVLLSDGDWNIGSAPTGAATRLRMQQVPVFCVGIGSETRLPDIALTNLNAPAFGVVNKTMRIPFAIESSLTREYPVAVTLSATDGSESTKTVRVPPMGRLQDTIVWRPEKTGEFELTLNVPSEATEIIPDNNQLTAPINIRREALRVLFVESFPRWEYRYTRNALERDPGVEVHCLLFHPSLSRVGGGRGYLKAFPTEQELFQYDVVFLGDVGVEAGQLTIENCEHLRQLVRSHAGGLVFLPGFRGKQETLLTTDLADLYPVVVDATQPRGWGSPRPMQFELTETGRRSLLTRLDERDEDNSRVWESLPGFQWYAAALRAKAGSQVLATHRTESTRHGRVPLIVTRTSGTGKVLFMGTDGAWRWREGVEDLYHYRFWGQVVRWMAYQRNMSQGDQMRLFYSPDRPQAGDSVTLNANVMSAGGEPLQDGTVIVQVIAPSGRTDSIRLAPAGEDSWGLFTGTLTPEEGGDYQLITTCRENGARLETTLPVQGLSREKIGQPARYDILNEIAQVTRGRMATVQEVNEVVDEIAELPEPEPTLDRERIWANPYWGGLIILLLGIFWTGRKMIGVV